MRRYISIVIAFALFLSVAGYLIPCTLHCLNSGSGHGHSQPHTQEQTDGNDHNHGSHVDCDGMCSTAHMSNKTSDHASASPMHQAQFMAQMLMATLSIDLNRPLSNPAGILDPISAFKTISIFPAPPVPPPRHLFLHI